MCEMSGNQDSNCAVMAQPLVSDSDALAGGFDSEAAQEHPILDSAAAAPAPAAPEQSINDQAYAELEVKKKLLLVELESAVMVKQDLPAPNPLRPSLGLGIEVIDDTALLETVVAKNRKQPRRKGSKNVHGKTRTVIVTEEANGITKTKYSRKEMEAVRFVNLSRQRKLWKSIYGALEAAVAMEYDTLVTPHHHNHDPLPSKKVNKPVLSAVCCKNIGSDLQLIESGENASPVDPSSCYGLMSESGCSILEEFSENDSEDDYASIQRPAFLVEGEPNFDSGPPEDGWEYLRRVRWEADKIPNVKVAKLDRSKVNKEQSAYMPQIPRIAECPEHLLPSKLWEDVFLAEFSALRTNLSRLNGSSVTYSGDQTTSPSPTPLLSVIFKMDSVARVSMLVKRISWLQPADNISRYDCMWLFALCATVDAPLDADTSAALRSLLRKCASIRAGKAELDDEVVMLNILATITGRYFGQSEN